MTVGPWKLALKSRTAPQPLMAAAEDERVQPIALDAPLPLAGGSGRPQYGGSDGRGRGALGGVHLDGDGHLVGDDVVDG